MSPGCGMHLEKGAKHEEIGQLALLGEQRIRTHTDDLEASTAI